MAKNKPKLFEVNEYQCWLVGKVETRVITQLEKNKIKKKREQLKSSKNAN